MNTIHDYQMPDEDEIFFGNLTIQEIKKYFDSRNKEDAATKNCGILHTNPSSNEKHDIEHTVTHAADGKEKMITKRITCLKEEQSKVVDKFNLKLDVTSLKTETVYKEVAPNLDCVAAQNSDCTKYIEGVNNTVRDTLQIEGLRPELHHKKLPNTLSSSRNLSYSKNLCTDNTSLKSSPKVIKPSVKTPMYKSKIYNNIQSPVAYYINESSAKNKDKNVKSESLSNISRIPKLLKYDSNKKNTKSKNVCTIVKQFHTHEK